MFRTKQSTALTLILTGSLFFALITADVLCHGLLWQFDRSLAHFIHLHRRDSLVWFFGAPAYMGSFSFIAPLALGVIILNLLRRNWHAILFLILTLIFGGISVGLTKSFFALPRPKETSYFAIDDGYTFPSGHTSATLIFFGILIILAWNHPRFARHHLLMLILLVCSELAVGWGLLYSGAHYLSDILGAYAYATLWLGLCLWISTLHPKSISPPPASP